ncbi:alpha/beta hydrolase [Actinacidiphila acidipaludis]|uniref:Alpha/beta hydrolase family protein n=1 Tax=Actinacidiphila acidipaludis TaxID=2873382 RepID=A0ABS7QDM5_9ACTN|nr:alpha/beta hydrolase [Streptomyces acidipaludis]MBY8880789.1 alpha/beta hydrolase family protein [Streptomyces acidipaludis]
MSGASSYPTLGFDPCPGDPAGVTALAARWQDAAFLSTEAALRLDATDEVQSRWQGRAAQAFRTKLAAHRVLLGKLRASYEQNADLLTRWAGELREFQKEAAGLEARAARLDEQRRRVPAPEAQTQLTQIRTLAEQLQERCLTSARALAREVDALLHLPAGTTGWYGQSTDDAQAAALLTAESGRIGGPMPADPALRALWWKGLSPGEQAAVAREYTGAGIDVTLGLPADVADRFNRLRLEAAVQRPDCPQRLKDLWQHLTDPSDRAYRSDVFLLGFDDLGRGHAAVSYGNPDLAADTAVYVPGTGASLDGAAGDLDRALTLYTSANSLQPGSTASIYWLGYDAPTWSVPGPAARSFADAGAPRLAAFVNSLAAGHQGPGHLTVIGHSYGSTVVGDAFAHAGMKADEAIFVGSPGVTAATAAQLGLDPDHVWASKAKFDPVPEISAPLDPLDWLDDHSVRFGNDPTSTVFGGRTFDSGDGSSVAHAHSEYWDPGPSLDNMTAIVTGHPDKVTAMPHEDKIGALPNLADLAIPTAAVPDIGGAALQNLGHKVGGRWGAPLEDAGDSLHAFGQAQNDVLGAGGNLLHGDAAGAAHDMKDLGADLEDSSRNAVRAATELFDRREV